VERI